MSFLPYYIFRKKLFKRLLFICIIRYYFFLNIIWQEGHNFRRFEHGNCGVLFRVIITQRCILIQYYFFIYICMYNNNSRNIQCNYMFITNVKKFNFVDRQLKRDI
jgi:hypothetical protein